MLGALRFSSELEDLLRLRPRSAGLVERLRRRVCLLESESEVLASERGLDESELARLLRFSLPLSW